MAVHQSIFDASVCLPALVDEPSHLYLSVQISLWQYQSFTVIRRYTIFTAIHVKTITGQKVFVPILKKSTPKKLEQNHNFCIYPRFGICRRGNGLWFSGHHCLNNRPRWSCYSPANGWKRISSERQWRKIAAKWTQSQWNQAHLGSLRESLRIDIGNFTINVASAARGMYIGDEWAKGAPSGCNLYIQLPPSWALDSKCIFMCPFVWRQLTKVQKPSGTGRSL